MAPTAFRVLYIGAALCGWGLSWTSHVQGQGAESDKPLPLPGANPKATPETSAASAETTPATDFVRFTESESGAALQTGIARYAKGKVTVDLIGAVHIADKAYFTGLNERFKNYDALLYELVGPPIEEREQLQTGNGEARLQWLGALQESMRKALQLESQLAVIDYLAPNFVHADMSTDQFFNTQQQKGESFLSLWWRTVQAQSQAAETAPAKAQPGLARLLEILMRKDSSTELKRLIGREFDSVEQLMAGVEGSEGTVIISERNRVALQVLEKQIQQGKTRLGIFYGAAHLADMERRLLKQGYVHQDTVWLDAWTLPPETTASTPTPTASEEQKNVKN